MFVGRLVSGGLEAQPGSAAQRGQLQRHHGGGGSGRRRLSERGGRSGRENGCDAGGMANSGDFA